MHYQMITDIVIPGLLQAGFNRADAETIAVDLFTHQRENEEIPARFLDFERSIRVIAREINAGEKAARAYILRHPQILYGVALKEEKPLPTFPHLVEHFIGAATQRGRELIPAPLLSLGRKLHL